MGKRGPGGQNGRYISRIGGGHLLNNRYAFFGCRKILIPQQIRSRKALSPSRSAVRRVLARSVQKPAFSPNSASTSTEKVLETAVERRASPAGRHTTVPRPHRVVASRRAKPDTNDRRLVQRSNAQPCHDLLCDGRGSSRFVATEAGNITHQTSRSIAARAACSALNFVFPSRTSALPS